MSDILDKQEFLKSVEPELKRLEGIRLVKLADYQFRRMAGLIGGLIVLPITGFIDYWLLRACMGDDCGAGITLAVLIGIWFWVNGPKRAYAKAYKKKILPSVAKLFGPFSYDVDGEIPMDELEPSKIIPHHHRYKSEDHFSGVYKGTKIRFAEIHLEERRRSRRRTYYVTVFKGLAVLISMKNKNFLGHTILVKNAGKIVEWFKEKTDGLKRANLVDPVFEKMFDVYTNDQVEARYLVDPKIIDRYKDMEEIYEADDVSAAYYNNELLVLLSSDKNLFEPAGLEVKATKPGSVLKMKQEVESILFLVDHLELYTQEDADDLFQII